jgi:hypothetical protein
MNTWFSNKGQYKNKDTGWEDTCEFLGASYVSVKPKPCFSSRRSGILHVMFEKSEKE